jgi:hypothetical protein
VGEVDQVGGLGDRQVEFAPKAIKPPGKFLRLCGGMFDFESGRGMDNQLTGRSPFQDGFEQSTDVGSYATMIGHIGIEADDGLAAQG